MADQRTMAEFLRAPTAGYAEAIVVPPILAEHFKLKHSLINMMTSDQFFGLEKDNPHDHIRWFNKITSIIKYKDVPNSAIKLMFFPFSLAGAARRWLEKEPPRSILTWEDLVSKFINEFFPPSRTTNLRNEISNFQQRFDESFHEAWDRYKDLFHACPHHGFTELHQLDTFYNALNPADQDSLNSAAGGNLLERRTQDVLTIIENKSSFFQMNTASTSGSRPLPSNTIANPKDELKAITTQSGLVLDGPFVPMPPPFINPEEDERADKTLTDPELTLLSNKEKLLKLANTPLNENCSAVILKKLPEKLGDPRKFLIPCGFSELKCKALADLGSSINLMPLSVWKKLGLPELISTRITLELANHAICTLAEIARDVFVPVEKFTFPAGFVIVDYESDPRVPLILGRPFLRIACALIDVHGEEMILRDGDERLTLNMRHDTSSYSNQPQKESINIINIYNYSCGDYLEDLFATNHLSGNPTFFSHTDLTSPKVFNPSSGSTTSSSPNHLLEEFADELTPITFPPGNDDFSFDIESDLRETEYLLNHDPTKEMDSIIEDSVDKDNLANPNDNLFDTIPEMFTDEHTFDYSYPPLYDDFDDDLVELEFDDDNAYNDPFDSKEDKIKEFKLLIDELYPLDQVISFLPSSILIHENLSDIIVQVTPDKNEKKISISNASLILEDFNPPLYEPPFHKEVPGFETLLSFSSVNEKKVFKPEILTSKGVHTSLLPELSHWGPKVFKVNKIFESPMEIFSCSYGEDIRILDVPCIDSDYSDSEMDNLFPEILLQDDPIPLSDIFDFSNVVRIFPPLFTYPVTSLILLSSGSEDTIFDPDISDYHFSSFMSGVYHRSGTFMKFDVYPNLLNESPMQILSSTCSPMNQ
nr:reverse transcriptase domain-containing protein [Tanacetum cinerariifolium]